MLTISGTVKDAAGAFVARKVRAYVRETGLLVGEATSDGTTGAFSITVPFKVPHFCTAESQRGDPSFSSVSMLLPLTGVNGSTSISDVKGATLVANGTAVITTADSPLGGSCLALDGSANCRVTMTNEQLDSTRFGTGDFTVEFWFRQTANYATAYAVAVNVGSSQQNYGGWQVFVTAGWNNYVGMRIGSDVYTYTKNVNDGAWHALAFSRISGVLYCHVDGVYIGSSACASNASIFGTGSADTFSLGYDYSYNGYTPCHLASLRITKGVGRYSAGVAQELSPMWPTVSGAPPTENTLIYDNILPV